MTYIVIELQTTGGVTNSISTQYANISEAEQKYHQILSYAAVSSVDIHAAVIIDPSGNLIKNDVYRHTQEVTNETE